jgi:hypothetical protein
LPGRNTRAFKEINRGDFAKWSPHPWRDDAIPPPWNFDLSNQRQASKVAEFSQPERHPLGLENLVA